MPWSFSTGTKYLDRYPTADKGATEARLSLQGYIGPRQTVSSFQCDGAKELYKAAIELGLCPSTSRPYVSQSNSVAERQAASRPLGGRMRPGVFASRLTPGSTIQAPHG